MRRRRHERWKNEPFPAAWEEILQRNFREDPRLTDDERRKLRGDVRVFVEEKNWEGCNGLAMTDEIRVTVAARLALIVLGVEHDYFSRVPSILVYPDAYGTYAHRPLTRYDYLTGFEARLGESSGQGAVVLSWNQIQREAADPDSPTCLVIHEFAHEIDQLDGLADGTPQLANPAELERWQSVMNREYRRHVRRVESGSRTLLDAYGATSIVEFFAVSSEAFFQRPLAMRAAHRELYELLRDFYGQDPSARRGG